MTKYEKVVGGVLAAVNVILGIFVIYATMQVGRLDNAFTQIGDMKGSLGEIKANVSHMQGDFAEMKATLRSIDGKLAASPVKPTQFFVGDPESFGRAILEIKPKDGFWFSPANPADTDAYQKLLFQKK